MPNAVWFITYKLVKGASVSDFLLAAEECNNEVLSKNKGFISWKQLRYDDMWADFVTWETMDDAIRAEKSDGEPNHVAQKFYSFLDFCSLKQQVYTVERSY